MRTPNLRTQISEVQQQVRAEITWQQHDYLIWQVARKNEDTYKVLFAQPKQASQKAHQCAGFQRPNPIVGEKTIRKRGVRLLRPVLEGLITVRVWLYQLVVRRASQSVTGLGPPERPLFRIH